MNFDQLTSGIEGTRFRPDLNPAIGGITRDSRAVAESDLFVALVGSAVDATRFVPGAVNAGAAALLLEGAGTLPEEIELEALPVPTLVVDDGRRALATIAHEFFGHPFDEVTSVAITGTNGKTTTALMVESIFANAGRACGVIGTIFFRLGMWEIHGENTTPESLDLASLLREYISRGASAVVLEASSHGLAMHRLDGAHFDVAVFTNLSLDHLDYHKDMESYFSAKRSLFTEHLPSAGQAGKLAVAVINRDDPYGRRLLKEVTVPTVSYGLTEESDVRATELVFSRSGTQFELQLTGGTYTVNLPIVGRHNVSNALAAAAACEQAGLEDAAIVAGLNCLDSVPGRLEAVTRQDGRGPSVFVDYAHTPDALAKVLEGLRDLKPRRLWVVFGCGGDRDQSKRPEMGEVVGQFADCAFVTSDNPRSEDPSHIINAIVAGLAPTCERVAQLGPNSQGYLAFEDRREAITTAIQNAWEDSLVLIAGKGHEATQEIAGNKLPFSDVEVAREALSQWRSA